MKTRGTKRLRNAKYSNVGLVRSYFYRKTYVNDISGFQSYVLGTCYYGREPISDARNGKELRCKRVVRRACDDRMDGRILES